MSIVPVILGTTLAIAIRTSLIGYYTSETFQQRYASDLGVKVEAMPKNYEYAYCKLENFSATYTIYTPTTDNFIFGLVSENDIFSSNYNFDKQLVEKFEYVGDSFIEWGVVSSIGEYTIPKGTHKFTLRSKSPFILAIYHSKPLITPGYLIWGDKNYTQVFKDKFTKAQFDANAAELYKLSCKDKEDIKNAIGEQYTNETNNRSFVNDYVYIPNAYINTHEGTDTNIFLYNDTQTDSIHIFDINANITPTENSNNQGVLFRTVKNYYTGQTIEIYLDVVKKDDPHRAPFKPKIIYTDFINKITNENSLNKEDLEYLHRTNSYFYINDNLKLDEIYLNFDKNIPPYFIKKVVEVIENISPSKKYDGNL